MLSPAVWGGAASAAPVSLTNPAVVSIPLGFLGCIVGTLLFSRDPATEAAFTGLRVRAEAGIGAEASGSEPAAHDPERSPARARPPRPAVPPGTPA